MARRLGIDDDRNPAAVSRHIKESKPLRNAGADSFSDSRITN
jgi:hypothetical protein